MNTLRILKIINVFVWLIFIGLCIATGAFIYTTILSLTKNPQAAENLYMGIGASNLLAYSRFHFVSLLTLVIISYGLKATLFYCIIKIISRISMVHPFRMEIAILITNISYISLFIGIFSILSEAYIRWIMSKGVELSNYDIMTSGSLEFLLLAGIVFVIAQIFKRGIELQNENELTI